MKVEEGAGVRGRGGSSARRGNTETLHLLLGVDGGMAWKRPINPVRREGRKEEAVAFPTSSSVS